MAKKRKPKQKKKKVVERKPNIKNIFNKWVIGKPEIKSIKISEPNIKSADDRLNGSIRKIYIKIGSQSGIIVSLNFVFDKLTFDKYLAV